MSSPATAAVRLLWAAAAVLVAGTGWLAWVLVTGDFSFAYVADTTTRATSWPYRLAGLWGGMEGSLLLWTAVVAAEGAVVAWQLRRRRSGTSGGAWLAGPFSVAVLAVVAGFTVPLLTAAWPFDRLEVPAIDGGGLNPVLEHPAMLVHPPLLYLGYAGLAVPFALTLAALWRRRLDATWHRWTRRSVLVCWVLLAAGMALGARWAYEELGWGGFWAWDPVENAALVPWLLLTAFLHLPAPGNGSGAGGPRRAQRSAAVVVAAFLLGTAGVVLTRSGAAVSVHTFAEAAMVGWLLLGALVAATAGSLALLWLGRPTPGGGRVRRLTPLAVSASAPVLVALAGVVAFGTLVPVVWDMAGGDPMAASPRFFVTFCAPPAAALVLLLVARGRRVAAGALLAHVGMLLVLVAATASALGADGTVALRPGEEATVAGLRLRLDAIEVIQGRRYTELRAVLASSQEGTLRPSLRAYEGRRQPTAEAALRSTPWRDVLVAPRRIDAGEQVAVLEVFTKPLVWWLWLGAGLLVGGGALSARRGTPRAREAAPPWEPVSSSTASPSPKVPDGATAVSTSPTSPPGR